jgi:hypothetical protein
MYLLVNIAHKLGYILADMLGPFGGCLDSCIIRRRIWRAKDERKYLWIFCLKIIKENQAARNLLFGSGFYTGRLRCLVITGRVRCYAIRAAANRARILCLEESRENTILVKRMMARRVPRPSNVLTHLVVFQANRTRWNGGIRTSGSVDVVGG